MPAEWIAAFHALPAHGEEVEIIFEDRPIGDRTTWIVKWDVRDARFYGTVRAWRPNVDGHPIGVRGALLQ
jgi:hypothetical protein